MRKILFAIMLVFAAIYGLQAQTTDLGNPHSWRLKYKALPLELHTMPGFDLERQLEIDAINEAEKIGPWRFGYEFPVNFGLNNGGTWTSLPNGDRIWRVGFNSPGALSMNVLFDKFVLAEGASVHIYRPDRSEKDGAYTRQNNNSDQMLGTSVIRGDQLIVEFYEPAAVAGQSQLNVGTVIHGYKSISLYVEELLKGLNQSGKCNYDVKCPLGTGWQDQINSVAIIMSGGSGICTGALINNTAQDGKAYFLTADHCLGGNLGTWVFRFNWDSPVARCAQNAASSDPGAPYNQVNGAVLRARSAGSDFGLLELNARPTGNIYYAGWDRSGIPATQATGIHHPSGDVKKISRENNLLVAAAWGGAQTWQIGSWDQGTTEPGSSGSPLFDQNKRIVGQLYGGGAACNGTIDNGQSDYYGRLSVSWTGGATNSTRLSNWLDPNTTGALTMDGYDPNASTVAVDAGLPQVNNLSGTYCNQTSFTPEVSFRNHGSSSITSATFVYKVNTGATSNYAWSGNLAAGATTTVTLPSITAVDGSNTYNVTVTNPNGQVDSNMVNNMSSATFNVILNGLPGSLGLSTDNWGSETTWDIKNSNNVVIMSGGPYADNNPSTYNEPLCLPLGCYTFTIYDSYGDGLTDGQVNGNYFLIGPNNDTLVRMGAVNFGASASHNFCVTTPSALHGPSALLESLQVYPNPTNGLFMVDLSSNSQEMVRLELYSTTGQLLQSQQQEGQENYRFQLDLSNQSAGLYLVKLTIGKEVFTRKVSKH